MLKNALLSGKAFLYGEKIKAVRILQFLKVWQK